MYRGHTPIRPERKIQFSLQTVSRSDGIQCGVKRICRVGVEFRGRFATHIGIGI
jgi:hypothetical protein